MSGTTRIEWADRVWNPVVGCTPVSAGCANCYAKRIFERFSKGQPFSQVQLHPERLEDPKKWSKPSRIFVNSMSDLFHEDVPDAFINQVFAVMGLCPTQTFMILTKRPERMLKWFRNTGGIVRRDWVYSAACHLQNANHLKFPDFPLPNVWLGVTAENQKAADERIPLLLETPAAVRFVSVEPMVGKVDLEKYMHLTGEDLIEINDAESYAIVTKDEIKRSFPKLDWVICGGETGPGARPMHPDWVRDLRDQCQAAEVPFFFKSWGDWIVPEDGAPACRVCGCTHNNGCDEGCYWVEPDLCSQCVEMLTPIERPVKFMKIGKKAAGRMIDGREWNEFPEVGR